MDDHTLAQSQPAPPGEEKVTRPGSCWGVTIESSIELELLREPMEHGSPALQLVQREVRAMDAAVQEWSAIPDRRSLTRLAFDGHEWNVAIGDDMTFAIDRAGTRLAMNPSSDVLGRELVLWTTPAAVAFVSRGNLAIHAAAVEVGNGRAVLLAGESGSGKTTTAAALHNAGHRLLSDDLSICRAGEPALVFPGPALLRLRKTAARRLDLKRVALLRSGEDKLYYGIDRPLRGNASPLELSALFLITAGTGPVTAERIPAAEGVALLWPLSFFLPDEPGFAACFDGLTRLLNCVPVYRIKRAMRWEEMQSLLDTILEMSWAARA
jgi:hypothetical protein